MFDNDDLGSVECMMWLLWDLVLEYRIFLMNFSEDRKIIDIGY